MASRPKTLEELLDLLHERAGADGLDVRIEASTEHDELSEVTPVEVTVSLPAGGRTVAEESNPCREMDLSTALYRVVRRVLRERERGHYEDWQPDGDDVQSVEMGALLEEDEDGGEADG